jgi:cytidine deaminase
MPRSSRELIERAAGLLRPHTTAAGRLAGDVGAVLVAASGKVFEGVCVDTPSWGLCAERSAIAAMITAGEYRIDQIVAVWRDPATNKLHVLPPCGHCREFMRQIDDRNLAATVILGLERASTLAELLPAHEWPSPIRQ